MSSTKTSDGFGLAISQTSFLGLIWGSTGVSFVFVLFRAYSRFRTFRRLFLDDALVLLAWTFLFITAFIWQKRVYIVYYVIAVSDGLVYPVATDFWDLVSKQVHQGMAVTILNIVSLWCVKFALLALFRKLGRNVRGHKQLWWFVFVLTVATLAISIGVQPFRCVFGNIKEISTKCAQPAEGRYIRVVNRVQAAVDVVSDCFITVIPLTLLWVVRLSLRLKLEICAVFCLTLFTMITAIIRVVLSFRGLTEDDTWLFSWSAIESAVAIIISCLIAYRASMNKEPVNKHYRGNTSGYRLKDASDLSSTRFDRGEDWRRGGKRSSTSIADEEMLPLPQAVHVLNDTTARQASL